MFPRKQQRGQRELSRAVRPVVEAVEPRLLFDGTRDVISLEQGWRFHRGDVADASTVAFNDSSWKTIDLPHTWNALDGEDGGDNYWRGTSWYRNSYAAPDDLEGRELFLRFEGSSLVTDVFVNGVAVGRHKGGFNAFAYDVTQNLHAGEANVIAIKVDNANHDDVAPISGPDVLHTGPDHTIFGGIYRSVDLIATDPVHVTLTDYAGPGVYVKQNDVSRERAEFEVTTKVINNDDAPRTVTVVTDVRDANGNVVLTDSASLEAPAGGQVQFCRDLALDDPHLWDGVLDPYLYQVNVRVVTDGATVDEVTQPLGLRFYYIDPKNGFFLNGRRYDLHGVNMHQDRQDKGWAISDADIDQDIALIKEIGATFVRLDHYPHDQHTYDLLDQAGIVVWTEIPYNFEGTDSSSFDRNITRQLREMIRQNFNHPSIFFWGLANALDSTTHANELIPKLDDVARAEDPTRKTVLGTAVRVAPDAGINHRTDAVAMNSYFGWYNGDDFNAFGDWVDSFHKQFPSRALGVAEAGAGGSINQHEYNPPHPQHDGPWHPEEYQAKFHEAHWRQVKERPYLFEYAAFNLFDFASDDRAEGDALGINDKGLVTYDRKVKKDAFYFYKANWSQEPTVYITSRRWTERDSDDLKELKIYSNLDTVELRINGKSLGVKKADDLHRFRFRNIEFRHGRNLIEAIGKRDGQTVVDSVVWNTPD